MDQDSLTRGMLGDIILNRQDFCSYFFAAYQQEREIDLNRVTLGIPNGELVVQVDLVFWFRCPRTNEWVFKERSKYIDVCRVRTFLDNLELIKFMNGGKNAQQTAIAAD